MVPLHPMMPVSSPPISIVCVGILLILLIYIIIIIIILLNNIQNYLLYTLYISSSLGLDAHTKCLPADDYV